MKNREEEEAQLGTFNLKNSRSQENFQENSFASIQSE